MEETTLPKLLVSTEKARQKIQMRIEKGQQLRKQRTSSADELAQALCDYADWSKYNQALLLKLFNTRSVTDEYAIACYTTPGKLIINNDWWNSRINCLRKICDRLEVYDEPLNAPQHPSDNKAISDNSPRTFGAEVFIVHGRDNEAKQTVARFVEQFGIEATILHEKPSGGLTIIEKIEKYSDNAGFAIVLITPDDVGALKDKADDESNPRARQNVIFELGYFMGKLGRDRVCPLFKGEVEKTLRY